MAVNPEDGARLAKTLADLYGGAVADVLQVVVRRLARDIDDPGWAEAKLTQLIALRGDALALVRRLEADGPEAVARILTEAYATGGTAAGGGGLVVTNDAAVRALADDLAGTLRGTHLRVLRLADDVYRQVIADTVGGAVTGVQSRREVAARAVDRAAARGVAGYVDGAGRSWRLESYVEMASRTAAARAHTLGAEDRWTAQGRTLVIVSDVPEECDACRPYEGAVLSLTGVEPTPQQVAGHRYAGTLRDARSRGFQHPNCRHSLAAFVPGLTRPDAGRTADPEGNAERVRQRALERAVRESKRRVQALEPLGDTQAARQAKALLRRRQDALSGFVAEHDRKRLRYRESLGAI